MIKRCFFVFYALLVLCLQPIASASADTFYTSQGDGNSGEGLAKIGRGEDTLSQGVAWAAGETVKLSMEHYPDQTTAVLSGLETIGEAADVAVEYLDDTTGEVVSTTWGAIPEIIRDQLVGAGKILTVVIPPAKVGKLKDLAKTGKISDIDFPDGGSELELPTIGGRKPINSEWAGKTHPSGIEFDNQGFPKFGSHAEVSVQLDDLSGVYGVDAKKANKAAGFDKTPEGYTWHHHQDGKTLQLVPKDLHNTCKHTGGCAVIKNGGSFD